MPVCLFCVINHVISDSNIYKKYMYEKKEGNMNNYEKIGDTILIELPEEVDDYRAARCLFCFQGSLCGL